MSFVYSHPFIGLANGLNTINAAGGAGGPSGGWVELGRTTLGGTSTSIDVTSLSDKRYYMVLSDFQNPSGNEIGYIRLGNGSFDSGSNYAVRQSGDGGADGTATNNSQAYLNGSGHGSGIEHFDVMYIANLSGNEKLGIGHSVDQAAAGATTAPQRDEGVWKWANTSNPLDRIQRLTSSAVTYASGSEVVVLGWDPADTHTNNFWEELASVELGSASATIDSGTITAKKYLWFQLFNAGNSSGEEYLTFNSDTGSNYARRGNASGGGDFTTTSATNIENMFTGGTATNKSFASGFIINNQSNEKLIIGHCILNNTAGAGTAPSRMESANKWANTSNQITKITFTSSAGTFDTGSFLKVWGAD